MPSMLASNSRRDVNDDEIVLGVLDAVERDQHVTQRLVASELGIALGLANAYIDMGNWCGFTPYIGAEKAAGAVRDLRDGAGLAGTPEQIVERLRAMEALGMTYAILYFPEAAYDRSGIELFEREVVPALR